MIFKQANPVYPQPYCKLSATDKNLDNILYIESQV